MVIGMAGQMHPLLGAVGPPNGGHGGSGSRQGDLSSRDAPPIFFSILWKRKRAVHGPKEKTSFGRNFAHTCKVAARESAYRCLLRFGLADRHAMLFCDGDTAVPWRMVRRSSGCKNAFDQLLFPRVPLRYALPWRAYELLHSYAETLIDYRPAVAKREAGCIPDLPGPKVSPRAGRFRP